MSNPLSHDPIVIVGQARTPMGGCMGDLAAVKATDLGATAIRAAISGTAVVIPVRATGQIALAVTP